MCIKPEDTRLPGERASAHRGPVRAGRAAVETDATLILRFRGGDHAAFEALLRRWENPVLRIAYRVTGALVEAEEIRQTVFLRFLASPGRLRQPESFPAWIRRCTINTAIGVVRRRQRRERIERWLRRGSPTSDASQPWEALAASDERELLASAMRRLKPIDRALLALRYDEGMTFKEIAVAAGRPISSVKARMWRAVYQLRAMLDKHGTDHHRGRPRRARS